MSLTDILEKDCVLHRLRARCKRESLEIMSDVAGRALGCDGGAIEKAVFEREQLGSTALGEGVAIPHGKIDGLSRVAGALALFADPLAFDAPDGQPVDIAFLLLAPANATAAHLKALARVSRFLRAAPTRSALRGASSADAMFALATTSAKIDAA